MRRLHHEQENVSPITALGAGLFLLFAALIAWLAQGKGTVPVYIALGVGLAVVVGSAIVYRSAWGRILRSRQTVYGSVVGLSVLFVLGIIVVFNIFAAKQLKKQFDFTQEKFFTLSEQSQKILQSLKSPVTVTGFFTGDPQDFRYRDRQSADDLLKLYNRQSGGKLTYEILDPYQNPQKAQEYQVEYESKTVFEMEGRRESTANVSETEFTAALLKVVRTEKQKVYFLTGHDERKVDEYGNTGLREVGDALKNQNYTTETISLLQKTPVAVPEDATAVVIAGPRLPYDPQEIAALDAYAKRGGRLLILLDPPTDKETALRDWLKRWGIEVGNDLVIDLMAYLQSPSIPVGQFEGHQITESFRRLGRVVPFRAACSVRKSATAPSELEFSTLLQTSASETSSWAETDFKTVPPQRDPSEIPGPVPMGLAVKENKGEGKEGARFVVIGDSDFASNAIYPMGGGDFFLNSVNWLALQENLISIPPKDPSQRRLRPLVSRGEALSLMAVTMFLMPALFAGIGVSVWLKRR